MRVCLIPMQVQPGKRSANLGRALECMERVGAEEPAPDLMVFPEGLDWGLPPAELDPAIVEPRGGPFVESLAQRARELGIYLAAGLTELEDECLFSCAVLIDPDADVILRHRRIAVGRGPDPTFAPGDQLQVRRTPLGRVGLLTGQDAWQAPLIGALGLMGAEFIIAPAGLSTAGESPAKAKALIKDLSCPAKAGRLPPIFSVAAAHARATGQPKATPGSFYRDAAGHLTFFDRTDDEEVIHLEVSP